MMIVDTIDITVHTTNYMCVLYLVRQLIKLQCNELCYWEPGNQIKLEQGQTVKSWLLFLSFT